MAMSCFILVSLYVRYELTYDQFHDEIEDIQVVNLVYNEQFGGFANNMVPAVLGKKIREQIPEVEEVAITASGVGTAYVINNRREYIAEKYYQFEPTFFQVFNFPFLYGHSGLMHGKSNVVISREMAIKYFQKEDVIGETIEFDGKGNYEVVGVLKDFPKNSQFQPHFVFPIEPQYSQEDFNHWGFATFFLYIKTQPEANTEELNNKIWSVYRDNNPDMEASIFAAAEVKPFKDSYWSVNGMGSNLNNRERGLGANKLVMKICSGLAFLLLFIALANYVNMATSKALERAKEVGIRKVNGAGRGQLIFQFIGETMVFAFLSLILAIIMTELLLPTVSNLLGISLFLDYKDPTIILLLVGYALLCGVLAGVYPAVVLSKFHPARALKGQVNLSASRFSHGNVLLFFQFTISALMITVLLVANSQINHYLNFDLGFNKERVVSIRLTPEMEEKVASISDEVSRIAGVEDITVGPLPSGAMGFNRLKYEGLEVRNVPRIETDEHFISMLEIPLKAGRNFNQHMDGDANSIIINESLMKKLELENPVGETIQFNDMQMHIVGVMEDTYITGAMGSKRPLMLTPVFQNSFNFLIKLNETNMASTLSQIDDVWDEYDYKNTYQYSFLEDAYREKLDKQMRIATIINGATIAIVVISLFGLFSMVVFQTSRRLKEIGIRKVLGATAQNILLILGKPYLWVIVLASGLAIPLAYYLMNSALSNFPNRIVLDNSFAFITVLLMLLFSVLIVLSRVLMALKINPVDILKDE